jgi:hypothetical protein
MNSLPDVLLFAAALTGLWWLYFVEYRRLVTDHTRQRLFRIRDELFECAERGCADFHSHAYGMARVTLNGMIKYTHRLTMIQYFALYRAEKMFGPLPEAERFASNFKEAIARLPVSERKHIVKALNDMHKTMLKHIVFNAPILLLVLGSAHLVLRRTKIWNRFLRRAVHDKRNRRRLFALDAEAECIGAGASPGWC